MGQYSHPVDFHPAEVTLERNDAPSNQNGTAVSSGWNSVCKSTLHFVSSVDILVRRRVVLLPDRLEDICIRSVQQNGLYELEKGFGNKIGSIPQHAESKAHVHAEQGYRQFIGAKPVDARLSDEKQRQLSQRELTVTKNRNIVSRMFSVVRLLARIDLPFRGHGEQSSSLNRGVFLELLTLLSESGDEVLANHLHSAAGNAKYTSPQIQNEMINLIGTSIQQIVSDNVRKASVLSVLMDETTDVSRKEQVAICVHFVDIIGTDASCKPVIQERLLALVETRDVTGQGLTELLMAALEKHGLAVECLVGQGYDGGSNMMAASKGVQARVKQLNPAALFTHCFCHSANRAVINAVCKKNNHYARNS